jgi:6-phosphogluconolactonase/glucosamine-6-phosphate isomerase/deaminase
VSHPKAALALLTSRVSKDETVYRVKLGVVGGSSYLRFLDTVVKRVKGPPELEWGTCLPFTQD